MPVDMIEREVRQDGTDSKDTLLMLGGVALVVMGAGLILTSPIAKRYMGQMGIGEPCDRSSCRTSSDISNCGRCERRHCRRRRCSRRRKFRCGSAEKQESSSRGKGGEWRR